MVGDGDCIVGGRNGQVDGAPKLDVGKGFRLTGTFWIEDDQALASRCIVYGNQAFAVVEPFQEAIAYPIRLAMLQYRPVPVPHREGFTACGQRQSKSLRM